MSPDARVATPGIAACEPSTSSGDQARAAPVVSTTSAAWTTDCATLVGALLPARRRTMIGSLGYFTCRFGGGRSCGRIEMPDEEVRP